MLPAGKLLDQDAPGRPGSAGCGDSEWCPDLAELGGGQPGHGRCVHRSAEQLGPAVDGDPLYEELRGQRLPPLSRRRRQARAWRAIRAAIWAKSRSWASDLPRR